MKLNEDEAKAIIAQVHKDPKLSYTDKYSVAVVQRTEADPKNQMGIDDRYPVGEDLLGQYPEYIITIDDQKGEAIEYGYYTGHFEIKRNQNAKNNFGNS